MLILSFEPLLLWHWLFDISSCYFLLSNFGLDFGFRFGWNKFEFDSNGFELAPDEFDFGMSEYLILVGMINFFYFKRIWIQPKTTLILAGMNFNMV